MSEPRKISQLTWVYISGAAFVVTLISVILLIAFAGRISFIPSSLYFVVLIPLGLASAACLAGALRSHAKLSGKKSYGAIELAGPVVVFGLVVLGGLFLANPVATFPLTVRVYGPGGPADIVRKGTLVVDLGADRRTKPIGAEGEVVFAGIPAALVGKPIRLLPDVPGYKARSDEPVEVPEGHTVELELARREALTRVQGTVIDSANRTVPNAILSFDGGSAVATSDSLGSFSARIPQEPGKVVAVTVTWKGRLVYDENITLAESPPLKIRIRGVGRTVGR
ncbi:MAG: hypothetical protein ABI647_11430 [Gemmatimonadota bacterium]